MAISSRKKWNQSRRMSGPRRSLKQTTGVRGRLGVILDVI